MYHGAEPVGFLTEAERVTALATFPIVASAGTKGPSAPRPVGAQGPGGTKGQGGTHPGAPVSRSIPSLAWTFGMGLGLVGDGRAGGGG